MYAVGTPILGISAVRGFIEQLLSINAGNIQIAFLPIRFRQFPDDLTAFVCFFAEGTVFYGNPLSFSNSYRIKFQ